ncbi:MAG: hypothetical protein ABR507_05360 [Actinomycetota bacterium]
MNPNKIRSIRAPIIASCMLLMMSASLALMSSPEKVASARSAKRVVISLPRIREGHVSAVSATTSKPELAKKAPVQQAAQPAPAVVAKPSLFAYKGLGAWLDQFDFRAPENVEATAAVEELASRGVRTIFVQSGKWNGPDEILYPAILDQILERAHAHKMSVVGWYLPGFNDIGADVRRSMATVNHVSPSGQRFDGFGPDIEERRAVGNDLGRFDAGIVEYSKQLRAAVGPSYALGAIVVDAKNNERAPSTWAGFPWPEIGQNYDVIVPMAYWSVTKKQQACATDAVDAAAYARDVISKTQALMGVQKPFNLIGGIADCSSIGEVQAFVDSAVASGAIGGGLYDYYATSTSPFKEAFWGALGKLNALAPTIYVRP